MIHPRQRQSASDVARHYDELDAFYRDIWGEHVHHGLWITGQEPVDVAVRQLMDHVAAHARLQPGQTVCDVGCGYGGTARYLSRRYGAHVTGLTLSPAQYAYACTVAPDQQNPVYLLQDWLDNDFSDSSFDIVVSIECISHVPDKARFFEEVARVLRPGGRLVLCAWLAAEAPRAWEVRYLLEPICREARLPGLATASEYLDMMQAARLNAAPPEDLSRQVRKTWLICAGRVLRGILSRPHFVRYLLDARKHDRLFVLTLLRLWIAYRTGALSYGVFTATKS